MPNALWQFTDNEGGFLAKGAGEISRLYFPLANEAGLLSSITPSLHGDIKMGQNSFLTLPVSVEDLYNTVPNRAFWINSPGEPIWRIGDGCAGRADVEAGLLWHKVRQTNRTLGLEASVLNFIPASGETVEIMLVELTNISKRPISFVATSAIPIFARSADRLRDHRHVSSLLNRILPHKFGVVVKPTMAFEERGHNFATPYYFVLGCPAKGEAPRRIFPMVGSFLGEGGSLDAPKAVVKKGTGYFFRSGENGREKSSLSPFSHEAIGALQFKRMRLGRKETCTFILLLGIANDTKKIERTFDEFSSMSKIKEALSENKRSWQAKAFALEITTEDKTFDNWLRWVSIQPHLRRLFGCSFLPDFDYGRGGRGWRDLWQDSLALLLLEPDSIRPLLLNNFAGVRPDGTNATIIGNRPGEFIPDRNRLTRTWMDHGVWPFIATELYIHQTGDANILFEECPYFDSHSQGTVLDHILSQHRRALINKGPHGFSRLEGGDWNDGLDMAKENGESVAFTSMYAGNLIRLADLLARHKYKQETIDELRSLGKETFGNIRKGEWLTLKSGEQFFNGYYDNVSKRVEGDHKSGVRMMLGSQVFPIMSGLATDEQIKKIYKSAKRYLWNAKRKGFRLNTNFGEPQPNLGRAFSFAYGEKENGAFFSHMNLLFAYALYKRGFVKEGFEVLDSIYKMAVNTAMSKIYPGLPEYFNSEGRGMYHYLTGSASWFVLTLLTQAFGIRGEMGDLIIEPKLMAGQFGPSRKIVFTTRFAGRPVKVTYYNPDRLSYGEYKRDVLRIKRAKIISKDTLALNIRLTN